LPRENARYAVWVETQLHGIHSLLVSLKGQKGVRQLARGSWELDGYIFDAERSTVLYPFQDLALHTDNEQFVVTNGPAAGIMVADLRDLTTRLLSLPNPRHLKLLDQTRDARRIAYVVSGSCSNNDSMTNHPRNVCFATR
jgi:hypothetical protein